VRRGEQGFITLWVLGLTVAVLFLGGLGLDLWRAVAVRREISAMADAAATAGANGLNESALRGGRLELNEARVRGLVASELGEYPAAARLDGATVTTSGTQVTVVLRERVDFSLLGIFMPGDRFVVQASATAEPRELP
jgi:putative Flp pilus-assembly TadE/G-like protein